MKSAPRTPRRRRRSRLALVGVTMLAALTVGVVSVSAANGPVDALKTTIGRHTSSFIAGTSTTITVRLRNSDGELVTTQGEDTVQLFATYGDLGFPTFFSPGVRKASFTATKAGNVKISGEVNGQPIGGIGYMINVHVDAAAASGDATTIGTSTGSVPADGFKSAKVVVQSKDVYGNARQGRSDVVVLNTSLGSLTAVTDDGNGRYIARLSSADAGTAEIDGTINGEPITTGNAFVTFS